MRLRRIDFVSISGGRAAGPVNRARLGPIGAIPARGRNLAVASRTDPLLHRRAAVSRKILPGIGLSPGSYGLLLALSIGLFLFWGGPFWSAGREASHLGRLVVSYLAVIPLAAILLSWAGRLTWTHFLTACGSAWAIKMVITVVLYEAFAGTGAPLQPRKAGELSASTRGAHYQPAQTEFPSSLLFGAVTRDHHPVSDAVVFLEAPPPGAPLLQPRRVEVVIEGAKYNETIYVARRSDSLVVLNQDSALHTIRFAIEGRAHSSQPLPASPAPRVLALPAPGLYRLSCANHRSELAWLLVLDHPYATRTDQTGRFTLKDVPIREVNVSALAVFEGRLLRGDVRTAGRQRGSPIAIPIGTKVLATIFEGKE